MFIQNIGHAARPSLDWVVNTYRTNPIVNRLTNTGLIFGGVHLLASIVEGFTGDNSIDTAMDGAAAVIAGAYAFRSANGINNIGLRDLARILTLGSVGYVVGDEIMAHQVQNGSLDGILDLVRGGYSGVLNVMGNLKKGPGSLGGILAAGGYGIQQLYLGLRR